ncbi:MAG: hypothetical protein PHW72_00750 [Candidatus Pacebacteria bacterium]|nr:hypothetical protein [Candidatus Paceibacterota bacterium]
MIKVRFKFKKVAFKRNLSAIVRNLFRSFIAIFFASLFIGSMVFYQYVLKPNNESPKISEEVIKFDEKTFQRVLEKLQERNEKLKTERSDYHSPF